MLLISRLPQDKSVPSEISFVAPRQIAMCHPHILQRVGLDMARGELELYFKAATKLPKVGLGGWVGVGLTNCLVGGKFAGINKGGNAFSIGEGTCV